MVRLQRWGSSPVSWSVQRPGGHKILPADALTDEEIKLAIEEAERFKQYHAKDRRADDPRRAGYIQFEQNILTSLHTILEKRNRAS